VAIAREREPRALIVGPVCGHRGADIRPNFNWNAREPVGGGMGYRLVARMSDRLLPPDTATL